MRRVQTVFLSCAPGVAASLLLLVLLFESANLPAAQAAETPMMDERSPGTQQTNEGDPVRGRVVFEKRCTGCHAMTQDREGPRLQGVYGRQSGEIAGFEYSPALKKAHIVWSDTTLEQWLADPDTLVPGNNMGFHVAKPQERRDLISFLKQSTAFRGSTSR
jgi:cytochrome c